MRYLSLAMLFALAVPAMACAGSSADPSGSDQETDIKVNCIVDFVTSELDDAQHDAFIADCMQQQMVERKAGDGG